jgi:hypothetical protein
MLSHRSVFIHCADCRIPRFPLFQVTSSPIDIRKLACASITRSCVPGRLAAPALHSLPIDVWGDAGVIYHDNYQKKRELHGDDGYS